MTVDHINVEASIKRVKDLMASESELSPALKASIEVLLLLISILVNRLGLNSKNSSKPPSSDPNRIKKSRKTGERKPGGQPGHKGKTLQQILQKVRRVNLENFLNVAIPLCDVLSYAHSKNVIHRDIKPSNVILFPNRGVKLMDFGIAKVLQHGGKDQTQMRGTPLYMAPEQIMGQGVDRRTDLYALGITFYEMLSGTPPFMEGDVMYAHVHRAPKPLEELVPGIDPRLSSVVMRCLEKDKNARFKSTEEIQSVLSLLRA